MTSNPQIDAQGQVTQLTSENADLMRRGLALQASYDALQAKFAQVQVQSSSVPAVGVLVPPMSSRAHQPKIPVPHEFKGEIGSAVEDWLLIVNRYMKFLPEAFASEQKKIVWAEMYLSTGVTTWLNSTRAELAADGTTIDTWTHFESVLRGRYQPLEAGVFARQRLDKMVQTGSVSAYNEYFQKTMQYLPHMHVDDRIHHYIKGLKDAVRGEVVRRAPKAIHEAMHYAIGTEAYGKQSYPASTSRFQRGSSHGNHTGGSSSSSQMDISNINESGPLEDDRDPPPSPSSSATPQLLALEQKMDRLFAMFKSNSSAKGGHKSQSSSGNSSRVDGVTKEEYFKCREKNVCLRCKDSGHVARDCTKAYKPMPSNW